MKSENRNLKDQNHLLLIEINKLRTTNKKYKNIDQVQRLELQQLQEECQAQRRRADELKDMVMTRMNALEEKVQDNSCSEKDSFLEILELSKELNLWVYFFVIYLFFHLYSLLDILSIWLICCLFEKKHEKSEKS